MLDLSREIIARWSADPALASLWQEAGITMLREGAVKFATLADLERLPFDVPLVLQSGMWPGVSRGPAIKDRGDETASASKEPWLDANGYWLGYLRALYPKRPPVLGYQPPSGRLLPFDTLELALLEAWVSGGNYVLSIDPRYRDAVIARDNKAVAAWRQLGRTVRWLREHEGLFRQPTIPIVTVVVEPGPLSAEIANLLYRRNASPAVVSVANLPPPDPSRRLAIVAANLRPWDAGLRARLVAHAEAGATVVATDFSDKSLKVERSEPDRDFLRAGRGRIVAYRKPVADPSEFALDVIDVVTHKRRAVRLWNGLSVIALATAAPGSGTLLHALNYGSPIENDVQARVQGDFRAATLLHPESEPAELKTARRGSTTEVQIPGILRLAVVQFS